MSRLEAFGHAGEGVRSQSGSIPLVSPRREPELFNASVTAWQTRGCGYLKADWGLSAIARFACAGSLACP